MLQAKVKKKILKYILAFFLLLIFHFIGILRPLENKIIFYLNPFLNYSHSLSTNLKAKYNNQVKKIDFKQELVILETENRRLLEENIKLYKAQEENVILRDQLRFLTLNDYKYELANVISHGEFVNSVNRIETITIDKGSASGLKKGLAVLGDKGVLIGKIESVEEHLAKIYLTNNKNCSLASKIFKKNKATGIVEGYLGLTIEMKFIPQDILIELEDLVISSGLEPEIPEGLIIGKVIKVEKENNDLWQKANVEPIMDYGELSIVSVLLN